MVSLLYRDGKPIGVGTLPGWTAEGPSRLDGPTKFEYGVFQKATVELPEYVYVFSKISDADNVITIPQWMWVRENIGGVRIKSGSYHVLIGESDGRPTEKPAPFNNLEIAPNTKCPDQLHDAWGVTVVDSNDPDAEGKRFGSWHPAWDPCYWW